MEPQSVKYKSCSAFIVKGSLNPMELASLLCTTSQSLSSIWSLLLQPEMGNVKDIAVLLAF